MTLFDWQNSLVVFGCLIIAIGLFVTLLFQRQRYLGRKLTHETSQIVLLVEDGNIVDETALARVILGDVDPQNWGWPKLHSAFAFRFPRLPATFEDCLMLAPIDLRSAYVDDTAQLSIQAYGPRLKIALSQDASCASTARQHVLMQDHRTLSNVAKAGTDSPFPMWILDESDHEIWRNSAYQDLRNAYLDPEDTTALFELECDRLRTEGPLRFRLPDDSELGESWYEVSMSQNGSHRSFYASNITALVRAEMAQRGFVQTLTKTFAQLGTGLAIFDRDQQLALFNPALVDLTHISAEFLTARPSLTSFFDWLRESRMMPEPRNYAEWREKLNKLSNAAAEGTFSELWSLPNGLSYRVLGRPHPDGAIAFLFEDVTDQLSLTRNFVKELEINHDLLDIIPQALVIFTSRGEILSVNQAYRDLWGADPSAQVHPVSVSEAVAAWSKLCQPSSAFPHLESALNQSTGPKDVSGQFETLNQGKIDYRVSTLTLGAKAVLFERAEPVLSGDNSTDRLALSACPAPVDA